jgi:GGDEF domain-containing protein
VYKRQISIQLSAGAATLSETMTDVDELLSAADFSLYSAKDLGGNQVTPASFGT